MYEIYQIITCMKSTKLLHVWNLPNYYMYEIYQIIKIYLKNRYEKLMQDFFYFYSGADVILYWTLHLVTSFGNIFTQTFKKDLNIV